MLSKLDKKATSKNEGVGHEVEGSQNQNLLCFVLEGTTVIKTLVFFFLKNFIEKSFSSTSRGLKVQRF